MFDKKIGRNLRDYSTYRKIRKITSNNKTGDAYGISLPRDIALAHSGTYFRINDIGDSIILESGCKDQKRKQNYYVKIEV